MKDKTIVYFVRHASIDSKNGKAVEKDPPLNKRGINESKFLAGQFKKSKEKVGIILTSTMKRAYQTADIIGRSLNKKPAQIKELNEFSTLLFLRKYLPEAFYQENYKKYRKSLRIIDKILEKNKYKTLLFIIHGNVIRGFLAKKLEMPFSNAGKISYNNADITRATFKGNKILTLSYCNSEIIR